MSEPKFTKGPITVTQRKEPGFSLRGGDGNHRIAIVFERADADLYAAAPEMYAELELVSKKGQLPSAWVKIIDALMAKARGE